VGSSNHVLDGSPDAQREQAIFGVVWPSEKHCESLLRCGQQKINNNNNSTTAAADCIAPDWLMSC